MRVVLVGPDYEANLSLLYLAASLRAAGHEPVIAPFNTAADGPAVRALARGAGAVGLSMCFQVRAPEFLELADALKDEDPGRPVIAGGHYASCAFEDLLGHHPSLDLVVIGEGERTMVELADLGPRLLERAGEVAGVAVRREGITRATPQRPALADLDALARPDRSGPARLLCGVPTAYIMGSRGCVSDCDYCCITTLHRLGPGPRFRQRSPEDVAGEMADLYHLRGVRQFVFHDDNFLVPSQAHNHDRVGRIDAALKERGVRDIGLVLKCSPRDAARPILETLRGMGLLRIFMGVESGSTCGLASIGRRQTVEQGERALSLCEDLGISAQYTMIILNPEATIASMLADLDFVGRHPAHPLNYCRAEVYAGTPLEARMLAQGRLEGDYLGRTYRYTDPKVAAVWNLGRDLFAGRCWGNDEILGSVIRLDHQVAVLRHFYEGRRVRSLAKSFLDWEALLNLETAAFFRELVVACGEAAGEDDPAVLRAVADIARRERPSREARLAELCRFRHALSRFSEASVTLGRRHAQGVPIGRRLGAPRHAAAVAVAIGLVGACRTTEGVAEAAPPPLEREGVRPPPPPDAGVAQAPPPPYRDDIGVAEAPPPPLPPRPDAAPGPRPQQYRNDHGVAEAAPPPWDDERRRRPPPPPPPPAPDAGFRVDIGVAEAAPPPFDPIAPALSSLTVSTTPHARMFSGGVPAVQPFRLVAGNPAVLVFGGGGQGDPVSVTVTFQSGGRRQNTLQITAVAPLSVQMGATRLTTPATVVIDARRPAADVVLEDPASHARVTLHLGR